MPQTVSNVKDDLKVMNQFILFRCDVIIGPGVKKGLGYCIFNSLDIVPTFLNYESIFIYLSCVNFDVK